MKNNKKIVKRFLAFKNASKRTVLLAAGLLGDQCAWRAKIEQIQEGWIPN